MVTLVSGSLNTCPTSMAASVQSIPVPGCMSISDVSGAFASELPGASVRMSTPCSVGGWLSKMPIGQRYSTK